MRPETQSFLDQVRDAENPTPENARRVLAAVRTTLAASAVAGTALGASSAGKTALAASWWKITGLVVCGTAGAMLATVAILGPGDHHPDRTPALSSASVPPPLPVARAPKRPPIEASAPEPPHEPPLKNAPRTNASPSSSPEASRATLERELSLLAEVQAAIKRGDGDAALRRLDAHRTDDVQFLAERDAARVLALCATARVVQARRAAAEFVAAHPTSMQRAAVESSCVRRVSDD
jgi:hypothetical protein